MTRTGTMPGSVTGWDAAEPLPLHPGLAIAVAPASARVTRLLQDAPGHIPDELSVRPARWTSGWREALLNQVARLLAGRELPGAWVPALNVPRFVFGQSQGICDLFGARVEEQFDGNYFVHPLPPDPTAIAVLKPARISRSVYWNAVEWIRYARAAARGAFEFRNPVMTGPFDTANYLLGTTVLMEWVYTEPDALKALLERITDALIEMALALRQAAGGALHGDIISCMRGTFSFCSECRSLVSAEVFAEFEAPCLARIGRAIGPYAIHSCGSWERTIPASLRDPNLRAMNGQVRENDLELLCRLAGGRILLSIGPSRDLPERYTWPDTRSFLEHVFRTVPPGQPCEVTVGEEDLPLCRELLAACRPGNP